MNKRDFLKISGMAMMGAAFSPILGCVSTKKVASTSQKHPILSLNGEFVLPPLAYPFAALEPNIDAQTMEIHHDKHHAAYVKKLNEALKDNPLAGKNLGEILSSLTSAQAAIRNNAGGHFNHTLFWDILTPNGSKIPTGKLAEQINADFGSYEKMIAELKDAALKVFGSGWVWLIQDAGGKLRIVSTANQDNPLMTQVVEKEKQGNPILGLDVWEHAYYLKYVNERKKYVEAICNLWNWDKIAAYY